MVKKQLTGDSRFFFTVRGPSCPFGGTQRGLEGAAPRRGPSAESVSKSLRERAVPSTSGSFWVKEALRL